MKTSLIAPCGMNCSLCWAYIRDKRKCPGCREEGIEKNQSCIDCTIKNCRELKDNNCKYCSDRCGKYPCRRLKQLDKRYSTKYGMSMLGNLEIIKDKGIRRFMDREKKRWIKGGKVFCVHKKEYFHIPGSR